MKYNLLVAQTAVLWMCDVVKCGDILVCPFHCIHYYADVLAVHLSGISDAI